MGGQSARVKGERRWGWAVECARAERADSSGRAWRGLLEKQGKREAKGKERAGGRGEGECVLRMRASASDDGGGGVSGMTVALPVGVTVVVSGRAWGTAQTAESIKAAATRALPS